MQASVMLTPYLRASLPGDLLAPWVKMALDHRADDPSASGDLGGDTVRDLELPIVLLGCSRASSRS
jgi:hypothetical protein